MRFGFVFLALFSAFQTFSQEDSMKTIVRKYCKTIRHELVIDPISIWMNKRPSVGHRLEYNYLIDYHRRISIESNGVLIKVLDLGANQGNTSSVFPKLNRSQLYYEGGRYFQRTKPNEDRRFNTRILYRAGYHYFQHSTGGNRDYWSIDSSAQTGLRTIAGFRSHSALLGLSFETRKVRFRNKKIRQSWHTFSLDYLFSPFYQIKLYDSQAEYDFNEETRISYLAVNRSGAQLGYQFRYKLGANFGYHIDIEALWAPFLKNYQPNDTYFVPRGGEKITPLFLNARAGLYWTF